MDLRNTEPLTAALDAAAAGEHDEQAGGLERVEQCPTGGIDVAGIAQGLFRLALPAIQLRFLRQAIVFQTLFSHLSLAKKLASDTAPLA